MVSLSVFINSSLRCTLHQSLVTSMVGIVDLPPELLAHICSFLCNHCDSSADGGPGQPEHGRTGLQSLLLSCQRLRVAAQPFAHHKIDRYHTGPNTMLVRRLATHPDLARHVRCAEYRWPFGVNDDMQDEIDDAEYLTAVKASDWKTASTLLLPLMTNLESLCFIGGEDSASVVSNTTRVFKSTLHLEKLRQVRAEYEPDRDAESDSGRFDLTSSPLHEILAAAPFIKELCLRLFTIPLGVSQVNLDHLKPALGSLRSLTIDDDDCLYSAQFGYLKRWIGMCSNLQYLNWHGELLDYGIRPASSIMDLLKPLGGTLVHLHLGFLTSIHGHIEAGGFSSFRCLEKLALPTSMLCQCPKDPAWEIGVWCANSLVEILPRTVKRLTLLTHSHNCPAWGHAMNLSYYCHNGDLQLKRLRMDVDGWPWNENIEDDSGPTGFSRDYHCGPAGLDLRDCFFGSNVKVQIHLESYRFRFTRTTWSWCGPKAWSDSESEVGSFTNSTVDGASEGDPESDEEVEEMVRA